MTPEFTDIRIVGLDEEHATRTDPTEPPSDIHFVLSGEAPARWSQFV